MGGLRFHTLVRESCHCERARHQPLWQPPIFAGQLATTVFVAPPLATLGGLFAEEVASGLLPLSWYAVEADIAGSWPVWDENQLSLGMRNTPEGQSVHKAQRSG